VWAECCWLCWFFPMRTNTHVRGSESYWRVPQLYEFGVWGKNGNAFNFLLSPSSIAYRFLFNLCEYLYYIFAFCYWFVFIETFIKFMGELFTLGELLLKCKKVEVFVNVFNHICTNPSCNIFLIHPDVHLTIAIYKDLPGKKKILFTHCWNKLQL
jgi:hypothetical protein